MVTGDSALGGSHVFLLSEVKRTETVTGVGAANLLVPAVSSQGVWVEYVYSSIYIVGCASISKPPSRDSRDGSAIASCNKSLPIHGRATPGPYA